MKKSKIKLACASLTLNFIIPQNISADWSYRELDEMEILVTDFNCENENDFKNNLIDMIIKPEYGFSFRTYSLALLLKKYQNFSKFANFFENTIVKKYNERRNNAPLINKKEVIKDSEELLSTVLSGLYRETFPYLLYESLKKGDFFENKSLLSEKIWNKWLEYLSTKTFVSDFNNPEESFREITDYFRFYTMKSIRKILLKIENNTLNTDKKQEFLKSAKENFSKIGLNLFKNENNIETLDFDVIKEIDKKILEYQKVCLEHPEYNEMLKTILKDDIENPENITRKETKFKNKKQQSKFLKKSSPKIAHISKPNVNAHANTKYDIEKDNKGKIIHKWKWETLPNVPEEFGIDADGAHMDYLTGAFVSGLYKKSSSIACFKKSYNEIYDMHSKNLCQNLISLYQNVENQCQSLESQSQNFKSQCQSLESQSQNFKSQCQSLESQCQSLESQCQSLKSQCQSLKSLKQDFENQVALLKYNEKNNPILIRVLMTTLDLSPSVLTDALENKLYEYIVRQKVPVIIEIPESDEQGKEYYRYGVITDIEVDYLNVRSGIQIRNVKFWDPFCRRKCTWDLGFLSKRCTNFWVLTN